MKNTRHAGSPDRRTKHRSDSTDSPVNKNVCAGHNNDWDNVNMVEVLDKESDWFRRSVKEAILFRDGTLTKTRAQGVA